MRKGRPHVNLALQLLQQINDPQFTYNERVSIRCALSRELEEAGNYEAARDVLDGLWRGVGKRPDLTGLDEMLSAKVLLRAGILSGWLGSARQVPGAQEDAKDLISESLFVFESLLENTLAAEAQIELGWCYWREGAFDEARITLRGAADRLSHNDGELKAYALLRLAAVERAATRLNSALNVLADIAPLVDESRNHALKGKFHNTLAHTLDALGEAENRHDYTDRALIESTAAGFHFEQAGHTPHIARVENNLGFLLFRAGRYADTHQHLDRARNFFVSLMDVGGVAQVDETRARTLLAQGRNSDAERCARGAVSALKKGGELALLAEALTTHGTALARLRRVGQSEATLSEAMTIAEQSGDREGAGRAVVTIMEELGAAISEQKLLDWYHHADRLLSNSKHAETLARLRVCASSLIAPQNTPGVSGEGGEHFLHEAERTAEILRFTHSVARTASPVLITGETGTGKEVLARLVHEWSGRRGRFVGINCAALSDTLLEAQMFGHCKGSFTDAVEDSGGAVCEAEGGTLFLDEIGDLSRVNQAKLLRLVEHGEISKLGSTSAEQIDVRIVAATNHYLEDDVKGGSFRADLFYRLEAFRIHLPPLRERVADIPIIVRYFIEEASRRFCKRVTFSPESIEAMKNLTLKGNARELRTLIERTLLTAKDGAEITEHSVATLALRQTQKAGLADAWAGCSFDDEVRLYEGSLIRLALDAASGRLTTAARLLGITHQNLSYILNGRQKELLGARRQVQRRRPSIIRHPK